MPGKGDFRSKLLGVQRSEEPAAGANMLMKMSVRRSALIKTKSLEPSLSRSKESTQISERSHRVGVVDRLNCDETKLLDAGHVQVDLEVVFIGRGFVNCLENEVWCTITIDVEE